MTTTTQAVTRFEIHYHQFLNAAGEAVREFPAAFQSAEALIPAYKAMVQGRHFDAKAISLQRTGRLGTFASGLGQEAVGVGAAHAMTRDDVLVPNYREATTQLCRGVTAFELFTYWGGDERGSNFAGPRGDFPVSIVVGAHAPQAAGVAAAFKLRGEKRAAVCTLGDGATSKGDVYEAMNVAGAWHLPVVFIVNNNQWAISLPLSAQTAAKTIAQKAIGCGFEGVRVDGNDVVAVHWAMDEALTKARNGGGPTLVEAVTYRLNDHTTADDASRYRQKDEVSLHWKEDPIARLRSYLGNQGVWTKEDEEALIEETKAALETAAEKYLKTPQDAPTAMFDHLYETLPAAYADQRAALAAIAGEREKADV